MVVINNLLFIATAVIALLNLLIEIEDKKTIKHEAYLKLSFGGIMVLSLVATVQPIYTLFSLLNFFLLIILSYRLFSRRKSLR